MNRTGATMFTVITILLLPVALAVGQVICSFESEDDLKVVAPRGPEAERVQEHATQGKFALKCLFRGSEKDTWPGLSVRPADTDLSKYQVFAFDVFNPSEQRIHLSWRIDDGSGKKLFGGQRLDPKKSNTAEIFLAGLESSLDTKNIVQIYPYIRCPRQDVLLCFDNFRFETLDLRFTPLTYEDDRSVAPPTAGDKERGYMLFARHWLDTVFPNSPPHPADAIDELKIFATPGEYEPITFSVRALSDLKEAHVSVSDLISEKGTIPSADIAVYPVRCLDKRVVYASKEYIKDMPVLLERRTNVDIPNGQSKRFYLDVHVAKDAPPGIYEGKATFRAEGRPEASIPIRLRVLPFILTEPKDMIWGEYYVKPKLAKTPEEELAFCGRDMKDMREHGMTSVGLCFGPPLEKAELTDDGVKLNLDGASLYERFMDLYRDLGYPAPLVQLADSGQAFASKYKLEFLSEEYVRAYKGFWTAMQAECKKRGWPEIIVQPVDEPGWQDQEDRDRNVALLKLLKAIPGMRTEEDGPGDDYFHNEAGPHADVWNYNGAIAKPEVVAEAQKKGHIVMLYNCDVESYRPEIGRYVSGFFQKRAGTSGCYNWAYVTWHGSPYDDNDAKHGTWMHVYPAYKGEVGGPSTGWQGFREGIDDFQYIHTMEQAIARARASGKPEAVAAAERAQETLKGLLATINYSPQVRNMARWTAKRPAKTGSVISGTLKVPMGWEFSDYDMARWRIADATLTVMEALGEIPPRPVSQVEGKADQPKLLTDVKWTTTPPETAAPQTAARQIAISILNETAQIDGDISDPVWQKAAKIGDFAMNTGTGKPAQATHAWLFVDGKNLCVAFECMEDNVDQLTASISEDGAPVWKDDCVEIFVDANRGQTSWKQIVVNCLGKQFWAASDKRDWRAKSVAAAKIGKDRWTAEVRIPLADLQLAPSGFGLDLCRERRPLEVLELSCWSPTGGRFAEPSKFGIATIGASFLSNIHLGEGVLGPNDLTVTVSNHLDREAGFGLLLDCEQGDTGRKQVTAPAVSLGPGESREVALTYDVARDKDPITLRLTLVQPGEPKPIADYETSQPIPPAIKLSVTPRSYYLRDSTGILDIELALSPKLRERSALVMHLCRKGTEPGTGQIYMIGGDRLSAQLNVGTVPPGDYELCVAVRTMDKPDVPALAETRVGITKLRGPFD